MPFIDKVTKVRTDENRKYIVLANVRDPNRQKSTDTDVMFPHRSEGALFPVKSDREWGQTQT